MTKKKWISLLAGGAALIIIIIAVLLINSQPQRDGKDSLVLGVDLSAYQGAIDWDTLDQQNLDFVFIKATEGKDYVDEQFKTNWEASKKTGLKVGAYHFLSYETTGKEQAQNFIKNVTLTDKNLPPVVDLELYGKFEENPLPKEQVKVILDDFLKEVESNYGVKPIIYTSQRVFKMYIGTDYKDNKFWIVDLDNSWPETLPNGNTFTFWQYTQRGILHGYDGNETFIDMDRYNGTYQEFLDEFTK
jgi:lysozyme